MNIYEETKYIMQKYDVHPNKNLGQNFLFDENSLNKIAENVEKGDIVLEIGPGLGTLTALLASRAKKVISVELDPKMCMILNERFKLYNNVEIINEDILKLDIEKIAPKAKIVANLPYYITTPIITELLKSNVKDITVLIQKEVADRICAKPGEKEAGAITYYVNYYADAIKVQDVPKEYFIPNPKVESTIINLKKLEQPRVKVNNEKKFFDLIKNNFTKRRKTILNSLSDMIEKEQLIEVLDELHIDKNTRGEKLTLEQYAQIANLAFEQEEK